MALLSDADHNNRRYRRNGECQQLDQPPQPGGMIPRHTEHHFLL